MVGRGGIYGNMHGDGQPVGSPPGPKELTDEDFCPLCGVCLPPQDRCNAPGFKGAICPHAEAAVASCDAHR